jgi:hypothetical protein
MAGTEIAAVAMTARGRMRLAMNGREDKANPRLSRGRGPGQTSGRMSPGGDPITAFFVRK